MTDVSLGLGLGVFHGRVISELDTPDDLAAGVPYAYIVEGGYWELPRDLSMTIAAGDDDTVTDVVLSVVDYTLSPVAQVATGAAIDAGTSAEYSFLWDWQGAASWSSSVLNAKLPQVIMQPQWQLQVNIIGGWTEGAITDIRFYRERYITGPGGYEIGVQQDEPSNEQLLQQMADRLA